MDTWQDLARRQDNIVTRAQLAEIGIDSRTVRRHVDNGDWSIIGPRVVLTAPGSPTDDQCTRAGLLHPRGAACLAGRKALAVHGLTGWERGSTVILVDADDRSARQSICGVTYVRTRIGLTALSSERKGLDTLKIEPATLLLASAFVDGRWGEKRSARSAGGLLAAAVQQRRTTAEALTGWLPRLPRLRHIALMRGFLDDIAGGSQSMAEIDLMDTCRSFGLAPPARQCRRRDSESRLRFTDAEWDLPDGRTLVLEVDGSFHRTHDAWEDDLRRQRRIENPKRLVIRCTAVELRSEPEEVVKDLLAHGVPRR